MSPMTGRRIFGKRRQSMEDSDAHARHHSTGIPQQDRSHVVDAEIRLHLWRLRALGAMRFATPRRLRPQSRTDRSRRNTHPTLVPAGLLTGGCPVFNYDVGSCSRLEGSSKGTFQMSWAYSLTVRSEENHAIRAMFSMLVRIQSGGDSHSLSTLLCVAQ